MPISMTTYMLTNPLYSPREGFLLQVFLFPKSHSHVKYDMPEVIQTASQASMIYL